MSVFNYNFFGFQIQSAIRFGDLPEYPGTPDIRIFLDEIPEWTENDTEAIRVDGRFFDFFQFVLLHGNTIIIDIQNEISDAELLSRLQGELMSALLRQRGLLVLHACCITGKGRSIGFIGGTCWGKSTLAEYFCQNGYHLLSDDILVIDLSKEIPIILPGYPEIHLRSEAGDWLREDYQSLPKRSSNAVQRITYRAESHIDTSFPLTNLYILKKEFSRNIQIASLNARQQLVELIRHTRSGNLLITVPHRKTHLTLCAKLINSVPIRGLERVKSLELLPDLLALVEKDVLK